VVPVFIFDISDLDILLIDRTHQAVSFPDMVVAIQIPLSRAIFDYTCSGRTVAVNPKDATRPVMAALVSTLWGVAPTYQAWDVQHSQVKENYMWAVGNTPFGPFSSATTLSFAQTEAAKRFRLYSFIESALRRLSGLFTTYAEYDLELADGLSEEAYTQLMQRWNLLQFKFEKARTYMGLGNYNASLAFLASSRHELRSIMSLLSSATEFIDSRLSCSAATDTSYSRWLHNLAVGFTVMLLAAAIVNILHSRGVLSDLLRRDKLHSS